MKEKGANEGQNSTTACAMNVLTRRLARVRTCLCYKINSPPYNFIFAIIIFLSFILWTSTPEGMVKSKLEFWMKVNGSEKGVVGEEETWLMETTQVRLWIGRKRLIGCELVFAVAE